MVVSSPVGRATTVVLGVSSVVVAGAAGGWGGIGGGVGGDSRVLRDHFIRDTLVESADGRNAFGLFKKANSNSLGASARVGPPLVIKSINRLLGRSPSTIRRASLMSPGSIGLNLTPGKFNISRNSLVVNDT